METVFTTIYILVDDWYRAQGQMLLNGKAGAKPVFSDSELLTLMLAHDYLPYPGETQYLAYIRANYGRLFPKLANQRQYNRRARGLRKMVEALRVWWLTHLAVTRPMAVLVDTKSVPGVNVTRHKRHSAFSCSAAYGYCTARKLYYFGYKLVMLCTPDGLPMLYDLVPANTDERVAAEAALFQSENVLLIGDKGFIGQTWQAVIADETGNTWFNPKRANQHDQNDPPLEADRMGMADRERIEGLFHQLQNTGRNLERLLAKTIVGLATRLVLKVTSIVLRLLLAQRFNFDILAFSILH